MKPHQSELPEVETVLRGQQPTGDGFHPSLHEEIERPSKCRWVRGSDHGRQPIGTTAIADRCPIVGNRLLSQSGPRRGNERTGLEIRRIEGRQNPERFDGG